MSITNLANKTSTDLTEEQSFARTKAREGPALLRFREYFELGTHTPKNPQNNPNVMCKLVFELLHPDHMLKNKEGESYPGTITISLGKGKTSKSMYYKLFKAMNSAAGNKHTHFGSMLGAPFLGTITHNKVGKDTYVNLTDSAGSWTISKPEIVNPVENTVVPIKVPELNGAIKFFVWEDDAYNEEEIREMWNTLYIDGVSEREGVEKSNNWIQDTIRTANDWDGSATQSAVDTDIDLPQGDVTELVEPSAETPKENKEAVSESAEAAALASLGLV